LTHSSSGSRESESSSGEWSIVRGTIAIEVCALLAVAGMDATRVFDVPVCCGTNARVVYSIRVGEVVLQGFVAVFLALAAVQAFKSSLRRRTLMMSQVSLLAVLSLLALLGAGMLAWTGWALVALGLIGLALSWRSSALA
jgi:hypothetical protein